jgi:hypothetical protein
MSYPKQLLRMRPVGIVSDIPSSELPNQFYSGGHNVNFRNGQTNRIKGFRDAYVTALATVSPGTILHVVPVTFGATNYWLLFEADGSVWAIQTSSATQIDDSLFSAITLPQNFSSALLNGIPIISNAADEPVYWPGTGDMAVLPDWTATESAGFITVFRFHIFAMNIDGPGGTFRNLVKWSSAAEPGTVPSEWVPDASNTAGDVELADGAGGILCAYPLRDNLIFYKSATKYIGQFVGGNQIFGFRKVDSKHGSLTKRSVCDLGEVHLVVEQGDIVLSDGINRKSIGESRNKDLFFNQLDQDNFGQTLCVFNPSTNEVLICYPSAGADSLDTAMIYNIANDSFGFRDLPNIYHAGIGFVDDTSESAIWDDATATWEDVLGTWATYAKTVVASESLLLASADNLELQDDETEQVVAASVSKLDITFDAPERIKFVKRLHVRAKAGFEQLLIRVGSRMTPTDDIEWSNEVALNEPDQIVNIIAQGRYISYEIRSNNDKAWTVTAVDIEAEMRGYH